MSDLFPTKTRLALLLDVSHGRAERVLGEYGGYFDVAWDEDGAERTVTAKLREMNNAGWVQFAGSKWTLTEAGRAVMEGTS